MSESRDFLTPSRKEHLVVDTSLGEKLNISLSMTFHKLTCKEVHVDAMDVAGDNQMNIEHSMSKQRISAGKITASYCLVLQWTKDGFPCQYSLINNKQSPRFFWWWQCRGSAN